MVDWDDGERGGVLRETNTIRGVVFHCLACQHHVGKEWFELILIGAVDIHTRDLARLLRCTQCGARKGSVRTWAWGPAD